MRGRAALALALLMMLAGGGCASAITPPPAHDSVPVYLTDYGRHSSLLIPIGQEHWQEYAFGDWDWFALNRISRRSAMRALFFSRGSTLGRRQLSVDDNIDAVVRATRAVTVQRFHVPRERAERLRAALDEQYNRRLDTITYNALSEMWFVRSNRRYSGLRNCNSVTAEWLETLGCRVRGAVLFSDFKLRASP